MGRLLVGFEQVFGVDFEKTVDLVVFREVVLIPWDEMDDRLAENGLISHLDI